LCAKCHIKYDNNFVKGWNKGLKTSLKSRKKISKACLGRTAWNKGRKETRPGVLKKQSISQKGQIPWNKGKKLHYTVWNKGRKETRPEVLERQSISHKKLKIK